MSRTRTPKAIARITGQADKHPERFNVRVDPPVSGTFQMRHFQFEKALLKSYNFLF